ncbi:hypothetical protein [Vibrio gazogenes]|uniref:DUF1240 domain-containing protein n=1 Tax=Vibrio gazogenes TaxID=687 RepID=A0A1Z2SG53_VIBGA|nr:hypothetical protein [Vibrio gazogenes]ASA56152.1 hypothetical protein BSQ33_10875 [Vibrio gazogenes]
MKEEITIPKALLGMILFGSVGTPCLILFCLSIYNLVDDFMSSPAIIEYERGALYGLGAGIVLLSVFSGFIVLLLYRKISPKAESRMSKGMALGLILIFTLPIVSGFILPSFIEAKGYQRCDKAERRASWPIYRTHIYTDNRQACERLIEEKQQAGRY